MSDFPSCCEGILGVPIKLMQGNKALSLVEGEFGVLSSCGRNLGVLELNGKSPLSYQIATQTSGFL